MGNNKFDVFISRKSEDAYLAKKVYDFLVSNNISVFESNHSLQVIGNSDYSKAIDEVLANVENMIVVGSSSENINGSWVEAEWRFFINRIRSGKVKGNIITIISGELKIDDLPPSLQNYEIIEFDRMGNNILNYIKTSGTLIPNSESENKIKLTGDKNKTIYYTVYIQMSFFNIISCYYYFVIVREDNYNKFLGELNLLGSKKYFRFEYAVTILEDYDAPSEKVFTEMYHDYWFNRFAKEEDEGVLDSSGRIYRSKTIKLKILSPLQ